MGTQKFKHLKKELYPIIRPQIKTFDFLFASGNYPISDMIKKSTKSIMSHVGFLAVWDSRVLLFESVEGTGVRMIPLSQYVYNYNNTNAPYNGNLFIARYSPQITSSQIPTLFNKALDLLNRKYDVEDIMGILARITLHIGEYSQDNAYICSEYVDVCYSSIGIVFPHDESGYIYPEHIADDPHVEPLWEIDTRHNP